MPSPFFNKTYFPKIRVKVTLIDILKTCGLKFMFSKKAKKIDEIFIVDLTLCYKCQIVGEDFVKLCCLLRKHEL